MIKICIGTLCLVEISVLEAKIFEEGSDVLCRVSPENAEDSGCWDDISFRIRAVRPLSKG